LGEGVFCRIAARPTVRDQWRAARNGELTGGKTAAEKFAPSGRQGLCHWCCGQSGRSQGRSRPLVYLSRVVQRVWPPHRLRCLNVGGAWNVDAFRPRSVSEGRISISSSTSISRGRFSNGPRPWGARCSLAGSGNLINIVSLNNGPAPWAWVMAVRRPAKSGSGGISRVRWPWEVGEIGGRTRVKR